VLLQSVLRQCHELTNQIWSAERWWGGDVDAAPADNNNNNDDHWDGNPEKEFGVSRPFLFTVPPFLLADGRSNHEQSQSSISLVGRRYHLLALV